MNHEVVKGLLNDMATRIASEQLSLLKLEYLLGEVEGAATNEVREIIVKAYFELDKAHDLLKSIK